MLQAFSDESFHPRKPSGFAGAYVVAGYMADSAVWVNISKDWDAALKEPPAIRYFKAFEYVAEDPEDQGEFRGMSKLNRERKLEALVGVLEKHGHLMRWLDSIITWDAYNSLPDMTRKIFSNPYFFGVAGILLAANYALAELNSDLPVDFVFDEKVGEDRYVLSNWNVARHIMAKYPVIRRVNAISFQDDKITPALQCADLLVWQVRNRYISPPGDKFKTYYDRLRIVPNHGVRWRDAELREALEWIESGIGNE